MVRQVATGSWPVAEDRVTWPEERRVRATKSGSIESKVERLRELQARTSATALEDYHRRFEMSWIHHDSAIEGIVYEPSELASAIVDG